MLTAADLLAADPRLELAYEADDIDRADARESFVDAKRRARTTSSSLWRRSECVRMAAALCCFYGVTVRR
jgi:hypothetical protein